MTSKVIAVTGGIGSGKSATIRYLKSLGYKTIDCDELAREVSLRPQTVEKVRKLLGDAFVVNGHLNRSAIRDKVFSNEDLLQRYNSIFFDEVKKMLLDNLSHLDRIVFVEISVFDAFDFPWDEVWLIESELEERKRRIVVRDEVSYQNVDEIMSRQRICSHYTLKIANDGNMDDLKHNIIKALETL